MGSCCSSTNHRLTKRERTVLGELCRGLSNKEIALEIGCSVKTVEFHVSNILRKTGTPSRARLVATFSDPMGEPPLAAAGNTTR
jgi:DNA-binding NarL/FixJ family response regulator